MERGESVPVMIPAKILQALRDLPRRVFKIFAEMDEHISTSLTMLAKAASKQLGSEDLQVLSMDACLQKTLSHYPFKEGERERVKCDRSVNFEARCNALLLTRVFNNLIKNALEQMELKGKGELRIRCFREELWDAIEFFDDAGGAPPELVAKIFSGYTTTKAGGTGVGLSFCRLTMEAFGGTMECVSDLRALDHLYFAISEAGEPAFELDFKVERGTS